MKPFALLIREKRQEKGYSMDKLCRIVQEEEGLKMSKSLLNFLEKGQRVPTYEMAYGLSLALDIDIKQALSAAYIARVERDLKGEKKSLEKLVNNIQTKGIDVDSVLASHHKVHI
ncbi:MAG: helix-turn-helix transcriptional regulator [Actinomycetota bacterium]